MTNVTRQLRGAACRTVRELEPALAPGDPGGLDAICGAELSDRFGKAVAYRAFAEAQSFRNFAGGETFTREAKYLPLALGQGIRLAQRLRGEGGVHHPLTPVHAPDGLDQLIDRA